MEVVDSATVRQEEGRGHADLVTLQCRDRAGDRPGNVSPGTGQAWSAIHDREHTPGLDPESQKFIDDARLTMDSRNTGHPDDSDDIGASDGCARHQVALLDVDRATLVLALEVGIDIGDRHAKAAQESIQCELERAGRNTDQSRDRRSPSSRW